MGCPDCAALTQRVQTQEDEVKILREWKENVIERLAIVEHIEETIPQIEERVGDIHSITKSLDDRIDESIEKRWEGMKKKGLAIMIVASLMMNGGMNFGPDLIKALIKIFGG